MNSPSLMRTMAAIGLPLAAVATIILAIGYVNDQQGLRLGANEPQEWIAQEAALRIGSGIDPKNVATGTPIDIANDPAPYVVVYDARGNAVTGTGQFRGALALLPGGVLDEVARTGIHRVTWEPAPGLREALVIVPITTGGYVLSGRSLSYTENQVDLLTKRALLGWLGTMLTILVFSYISALLLKKRT